MKFGRLANLEISTSQFSAFEVVEAVERKFYEYGISGKLPVEYVAVTNAVVRISETYSDDGNIPLSWTYVVRSNTSKGSSKSSSSEGGNGSSKSSKEGDSGSKSSKDGTGGSKKSCIWKRQR